MAQVALALSVTPSAGVRAFWLALDDVDVVMTDNKGSVTVDSDAKHILVWHFIGNSGDTLAIEGQVAGRTVVKIKQTTIPPGEQAGAGTVRFGIS